MPLTLTYTPANMGTHAHDFVRALIHDTKTDRILLDDAEVDGMLAQRALVPTSDPVANRAAVYMTAAECARMIQAKFSSEAEIALTPVGPLKRAASDAYRQLAGYLEDMASRDAAPQFLDPTTVATADAVNANGYPNDWVAGVDGVPELDTGSFG